MKNKKIFKLIATISISALAIMISVILCAACQEGEPTERPTINTVPTTVEPTTTSKETKVTYHIDYTLASLNVSITPEESSEEATTVENTIEETTELTTEYVESTAVQSYTYYYILAGGKHYTLSHELQEYGQDLIRSLGMEEYIPYWYMQCYQESAMNMGSVGRPHGGYSDYGIMQIWEGLEHDKWSPIYTIIRDQYPDYKTDPYDNIACGIYQFYHWYRYYGGDIINALGSYLSGNYDDPSQTYINHVLSHKDKLYREE